MHEEEVIIELPDPVPPAEAIRGTMIVTSQQLMRDLGRDQEYWENLTEADAKALREILVASWVPIDLGVAHYEAVEALGLPDQVAFENGIKSGDRVNKAFIGTTLRSMRATGAISPLTLLSRYDRLFGRLIKGGAVRVVRTGPKDARAEMHGTPFGQFRYVRAGWRGIFEGAFGLMSKKVFVRQARDPAPDAVAYTVSWV